MEQSPKEIWVVQDLRIVKKKNNKKGWKLGVAYGTRDNLRRTYWITVFKKQTSSFSWRTAVQYYIVVWSITSWYSYVLQSRMSFEREVYSSGKGAQ